MNVSPADITQRLEGYRNYLRFMARRSIPRDLQGKLDASDVVQETLIKAHAGMAKFRGDNTQEVMGFLNAILRNQLIDECRRLTADKRDARLEKAIDATIADSSVRLGSLLPADQSSPSEQAVRQERLPRLLADALNQLPDDERSALELREFDQRTLHECANMISVSRTSFARLLNRALTHLRELLASQER